MKPIAYGDDAAESLRIWNRRRTPERPWLRRPLHPGIWEVGFIGHRIARAEVWQDENGLLRYVFECDHLKERKYYVNPPEHRTATSVLRNERWRYVASDWPIAPEEAEAGQEWTDEMKSMAKRIADEMPEREQEDIEQWAERLAEDVSKLTD